MLITGASVSNNHNGVTNPAKRVADLMHVRSTNKSYSNTPSDLILNQLNTSRIRIKKYKSLVSVDLFFWDSVKGGTLNCKPGYVRSVLRKLRRISEHLFLAQIPLELAKGSKECVQMINEDLKLNCLASESCTLINPIQLGNTEEARKLLQSDGLHLSNLGADAAMQNICEGFMN